MVNITNCDTTADQLPAAQHGVHLRLIMSLNRHKSCSSVISHITFAEVLRWRNPLDVCYSQIILTLLLMPLMSFHLTSLFFLFFHSCSFFSKMIFFSNIQWSSNWMSFHPSVQLLLWPNGTSEASLTIGWLPIDAVARNKIPTHAD